MKKKRESRRELLERMAARASPADVKTIIEQRLEAARREATDLLIGIRAFESNPHINTDQKSQVDGAYAELEKLEWIIQHFEEQLVDLVPTHIGTVVGLNRAQRRQRERYIEHPAPDTEEE